MEQKRIELTNEEIAIIEKELSGGFEPFAASEEDRATLNNVIGKADELLRELDAYEEIEDSLLAWYYNKYKSQLHQ